MTEHYSIQPPRFAVKLIKWLAAHDIREEILGDMAETHEFITKRDGINTADEWYRSQVLTSARDLMTNNFSSENLLKPVLASILGIIGAVGAGLIFMLLKAAIFGVPNGTPYDAGIVALAAVSWTFIGGLGGGIAACLTLGRINYLVMAIVGAVVLRPDLLIVASPHYSEPAAMILLQILGTLGGLTLAPKISESVMPKRFA